MPSITGLADLLTKLDALESLVTQRQILVKAIRAGSMVIREEAERRAPRDTGSLAENMTVSVTERTATHVVGLIGPSRKVYYGIFQELGTAFHVEQPFLEPAWESKVDEATKIVANVLWDEILSVSLTSALRSSFEGSSRYF